MKMAEDIMTIVTINTYVISQAKYDYNLEASL